MRPGLTGIGGTREAARAVQRALEDRDSHCASEEEQGQEGKYWAKRNGESKGMEEGESREGEEVERQEDGKGDCRGAEGKNDGHQGTESRAKNWEYSGYECMA